MPSVFVTHIRRAVLLTGLLAFVAHAGFQSHYDGIRIEDAQGFTIQNKSLLVLRNYIKGHYFILITGNPHEDPVFVHHSVNDFRPDNKSFIQWNSTDKCWELRIAASVLLENKELLDLFPQQATAGETVLIWKSKQVRCRLPSKRRKTSPEAAQIRGDQPEFLSMKPKEWPWDVEAPFQDHVDVAMESFRFVLYIWEGHPLCKLATALRRESSKSQEAVKRWSEFLKERLHKRGLDLSPELRVVRRQNAEAKVPNSELPIHAV